MTRIKGVGSNKKGGGAKINDASHVMIITRVGLRLIKTRVLKEFDPESVTGATLSYAVKTKWQPMYYARRHLHIETECDDDDPSSNLFEAWTAKRQCVPR